MRRALWFLGLAWTQDALAERNDADALWAGVDPERKKRVRRAVARGEAVADPRDAGLAVRWSQHLRAHAILRRVARAELVHVGILVLVGLLAWAAGGSPLIPALGAFAAANLMLLARWIEQRAYQAEVANLSLRDAAS